MQNLSDSDWYSCTDSETGKIFYTNTKSYNIVNELPEESNQYIYSEQEQEQKVQRLEKFFKTTNLSLKNYISPISPDVSIDLRKESGVELIQKIDSMDILTYAEKILTPKKTFFGTKIPFIKVLQYQKDLINNSLTDLEREDLDSAIDVFIIILAFVGEYESEGETDIKLAQRFLTIAYKGSKKLRDEMFLQLVKMTRDAPDNNKLIRVWKLFALYSATILPSNELIYPLLNYILNEEQAKANQNEEIRSIIRYCYMKILRNMKGLPRISMPSIIELKAIFDMSQIIIRVNLFNGYVIDVPAEPHTDVKDVKDYIMKKLNLKLEDNIDVYGLIEVLEKEDFFEERYVEKFVRICDILSQWEINRLKGEDINDYKLYFCIRIYMPYTFNNYDYTYLLYHQICWQMYNNLFPLKEQQVITFVCLKLIQEFGEKNEELIANLKKKYTKYIPNQFLTREKSSHSYWEQKMQIILKQFGQTSAFHCRLASIQMFVNYPTFQSNLFQTQIIQLMPDNQNIGLAVGEKLIIAIKPFGVFFLSQDTYQFIKHKGNKQIIWRRLSEIMTWGSSKDTFVLGLSQCQICFQTSQALSIDYCLSMYTAVAAKQSNDSFISLEREAFERIPIVNYKKYIELRGFSRFRKNDNQVKNDY